MNRRRIAAVLVWVLSFWFLASAPASHVEGWLSQDQEYLLNYPLLIPPSLLVLYFGWRLFVLGRDLWSQDEPKP